MDLKGKVALITSSDGSIGTATASHFASLGMRIALVSQEWGDIREQVEDIEKGGGQAIGIGISLNSGGLVPIALERIIGEYEVPSVVVHCADRAGPVGSIHECNAYSWAEAVTTNLIGGFHVISAVLEYMLPAGGGTIITVSTSYANEPVEGWSSYCSGKAGLMMLTRCVDKEYRDQGVNAYELMLGREDTELRVARPHETSPSDQLPPYAAKVAKASAWLASATPAHLRGCIVSVDDPEVSKAAGL